MLKRILDNYYSNNLINTIYYYIHALWDFDIKTTKGKDYCLIFVKERKEEKYNLIYKFKKDKALIYISNIDDVIEEVKRNINDYSERNDE